MKLTLIAIILTFIPINLKAQAGIGTSSPNPSAILDLTTTNKALLITRVANTAAIANPVNGMLIYDLSSECFKAYENSAWTDCLSKLAVVESNCNTNGFTGVYQSGTALSGEKFSVTITNNTNSTTTISFATSNLALSGVSGITVDSVAPSTISLTTGQSQLVEYTLSGTPANSGTLTGIWTNGTLNCNKTVLIN
jgi:hypothetical protein